MQPNSNMMTRNLRLALFQLSLIGLATAVRTRITWVNGIAYSLHHMEEGQVEISKYFGGKKPTYYYNPTAMADEDDMLGYLGDLTQAGTQKLGRITAEVDSLVKHLREALAEVGSKGCVIHIAHSQGALITSLASRQLTPDELRRVEVIAFGGAAALRKTAATPFRRCINYYSVNDPLLFVVPSAAQALRSGFVGDAEFCFLAPRLGYPVADHHIFNPTYAQALQWEGIRYQREYYSLTYRAVRSLWTIFLVLLEAVSARLHALLKTILRPVILWCLFAFEQTQAVYRQISDVLDAKVKQPLVMFAPLLLEYAEAVVRKCTGEEKYIPISRMVTPYE